MINQKVAFKLINRILSEKKYFNRNSSIEELTEFFHSFTTEEIEETINSNPEVFQTEGNKIKLKKVFASCSCSRDPYECKFNWSEAMVQCGDTGLVIKKDGSGSYTTAFFEAFPLETFIRGEGETILAAEEKAWEKFKKIENCPSHEFERRGRKDSYGTCKNCNYFKKGVFELLTHCEVCKVKTNEHGLNGRYYCDQHYYALDWEKDVAPTLKAEPFDNWLEQDFKLHKKIITWLEANQKTLTIEERNFFYRIYESIYLKEDKEEYINEAMPVIYEIVVEKPSKITAREVLERINRVRA